MTYTFDGEVEIQQRTCGECGNTHEKATGFVLNDGDAHAVYWWYWYPHENQAFVDATLGSWHEPNYPDHVTFGSRIGKVDGYSGPQCTLVLPQTSLKNETLLGRKLTREEALQHPWVDSFWSLVDWLVENDPLLRKHMHQPA